MDNRTPVLVLGPPRYVGPLGVMRSLGSLGVDVYAAHHRSLSAPNASRFCRGTFDIGVDGRPSGNRHRDLEQLLAAGKRLGSGTVLFAGSDEWALFAAEHDHLLRPTFRFPSASPSVLEQLASKDGLYQLCVTHDIPTPRIAFPSNLQDATRLSQELAFPVFVKPVVSRPRGQWKEIVHDATSLISAYRQMEESPDDPNVLFQEFLPGGDHDVWMLDGYFDSEGRPLLAYTGRKLRQHPATMGIATFAETAPNQDVVAITQKLIDITGYRGLVDIGYRYDRRDGQYKILDFNPRLGGCFRLFVGRSGLDVARALYLDQTGQQVSPEPMISGRRWLKEDADIIAFHHYRRMKRIRLVDWVRSWITADEAALFSLRDPGPLAVALLRLAFETVSRKTNRRMRRGTDAVGRLIRHLVPRAT